jgi:hypothetical protein
MNEDTLKQIIEVYQQKTFDLFNRNIALEAQILSLQRKLNEITSSDLFNRNIALEAQILSLQCQLNEITSSEDEEF